MYAEGCLICHADLIYLEKSEPMKCSICNKTFDSQTICSNGHFVCDECHELEGIDYIEECCIHSRSTNPVALADSIMQNPALKLHGPEHHFLVPAVLITAYYNKTGNAALIPEKLVLAKKRAKRILGGFCGFYGNCGAGVGAGIFLSIYLNTTPLSTKEWQLSNLITAQCLNKIALCGGPRCCKRNTFHALETAVAFMATHLKVTLDTAPPFCSYYPRNKECLSTACTYFPGKTKKETSLP